MDTPCQSYRTDITRLEAIVYPNSLRKRRDGQNEDKKASHLKKNLHISLQALLFSHELPVIIEVSDGFCFK